MNKPVVKLHNWATVNNPDPYTAPELQKLKLSGNAYGHSLFEDGKEITTTSVLSITGRKIETKNTIYVLGRIAPQFRKWLRTQRPQWNWRKPIKQIER